MDMSQILREVGRGKRGSRDLNYTEALTVAEKILKQEVSPAQTAAFLMAERMKMENVEELEAFVHACRNSAERFSVFQDGLDCAGPYDGRTKSFMATFPVAFVLAAAGLPVTLHGSDPLPPKWGVTLSVLLKEVGIDTHKMDREDARSAALRSGVMYVSSEDWCAPLRKLRPLREELGFRTVFNTAEKLIDYNHSPYLVFGVFHNTFLDRIAKLLTRFNYRRAYVVQGMEGSEDLYIDRPTRVYVVEDGDMKLELVDPAAYELDMPVPELVWTAAKQLEVAESVLSGDGHIAFVNQVLLNGGFRLYAAGRVNSIEEGIYTCQGLLESGAAYRIYQQWCVSMGGELPDSRAVSIYPASTR
ncbi:anthranilate phosphoribosyltransferase [Paenibacillus sp. W2I17]|uniref:anthranilate phosphoribosyltransferase n=1 Tax=Paenibacillus sp. W2I17 TaxID=3042311 RepID=UPI00277FD803|nr:anthranilate phosphoribosyltransferase [Paenibacillus sp. W2I17]MDQ0659624.1 anthranilate phosphoribosyltransferase [Paenibacillus sp. W2I17]